PEDLPRALGRGLTFPGGRRPERREHVVDPGRVALRRGVDPVAREERAVRRGGATLLEDIGHAHAAALRDGEDDRVAGEESIVDRGRGREPGGARGDRE